MWNRGYIPVGSTEATVAYEDALQRGLYAYHYFWSPSNWFGLYTDGAFKRVRKVVTKLWDRFQHGTKSYDSVQFSCWTKNEFDGTAYHADPAGRIHLDVDGIDHPTIIHEMLHKLVDDNDLPDQRHDVCTATDPWPSNFEFLSGDLNVCYGPHNSRKLMVADRTKARRNVDNYETWIGVFFPWTTSQVGYPSATPTAAEITTGCWPPKWFPYGRDKDNPATWVPPPPGICCGWPPR